MLILSAVMSQVPKIMAVQKRLSFHKDDHTCCRPASRKAIDILLLMACIVMAGHARVNCSVPLGGGRLGGMCISAEVSKSDQTESVRR